MTRHHVNPRRRTRRRAAAVSRLRGMLSLVLVATAAGVSGGLSPALAQDAPAATDECCDVNAPAGLARFRKAVGAARGARLSVAAQPGDRPDLACAVEARFNVGYRSELPREALAEAGFRVIHDSPGLRLATVEDTRAELASEPALRRLRVLADWRLVEPDYVLRPAARPPEPLTPVQTGLAAIEGAAARELAGGAGITVAVLDTGVDRKHPDLQGRLADSVDLVTPGGAGDDDHGHGTAVAGIIAAVEGNGYGIAGVAPQATILPIKVADGAGQAGVGTVIAGIAAARRGGARVINLSLGTWRRSAALAEACRAAVEGGAVVIAAAGNEPVHEVMSPAREPEVLAVTATSDSGEPAWSGVLAPAVDLGAPGEGIMTTLPGGVFGTISGSSASAAFASGVAALVLSREPRLDAVAVGAILRGAGRPIAALQEHESLQFGFLSARRAVESAVLDGLDPRIVAVRLIPRRPVPGQPLRVELELAQRGGGTVDGLQLEASIGEASAMTEAAPLAPGASGLAALTLEVPESAATGALPLALSWSWAAGPDRRARAELTQAIPYADGLRPDWRIEARRFRPSDGKEPARLEVEVRNVGALAVSSVKLTGSVEGFELEPATALGRFGPGAKVTLDLDWSIPAPAPLGAVRAILEVTPARGESATDDNLCLFDFVPARPEALETLYQQSNGVDVELDAPRRIVAGTGPVPVQFFVPAKGAFGSAAGLRVTTATVHVMQDAAGAGRQIVWRHRRGQAASPSPAGLELIDEVGTPTGTTQLFGSADLVENGRHEILRMPRAALGLSSGGASVEEVFLDVRMAWSYRRVIFYVFSSTRTGAHRKVLRVESTPGGLPRLPGENHYYDAHFHTIAEWSFGSPLDLFAPRKAYGGPLQMVKEVARCLGLTGAGGSVRNRVVTTDHNCFYNTGIPDPDGPRNRPPFGPSSIRARPTMSEFESYRDVFGITAGEEVTFKQSIRAPSINSFVDQLLGFLPGLPIGAHMLLYRHPHVEGPWHGGGFLGGPKIDVELEALLDGAAHQPGAGGGSPFAFAAHPFSGMGWEDGHLQREFGLDPAQRSDGDLHGATGKFVVKGLQVFNGGARRSLDKSRINFRDLNPWADSDFAAGRRSWDGLLWKGLSRWHDMLSQTLDYSHPSDPERRFIRKLYAVAGSDAHGDFNVATSRLATPISIKSTYKVVDGHFFDARTYVFGEGKAGADETERFFAAFADGNSCITDGPVMRFHLDANTRWDEVAMQWHDDRTVHEDRDGRMGGDGPLDGGRTALVQRWSPHVGFGYEYEGGPGFGTGQGEVRAIHIYKSELGAPNPTATVHGREILAPAGRLAANGAGVLHTEALDLNEEGAFGKLGAVSLGAFTGADPATSRLAVDDRRCYTNPIWVVPFDLTVRVSVDPTTQEVPPGGLELEFDFDISMNPNVTPLFELKGLDASGESSNLTEPALTALEAKVGTGWSDARGIRSSRLVLVNRDSFGLAGAVWPAPGQTAFVAYSRQPLEDSAGNALNAIASRIVLQRLGSSGPATVVSPITAQPTPAPIGGDSDDSGWGCSVAGDSRLGTDRSLWLVLLVLLLLGPLRRRG